MEKMRIQIKEFKDYKIDNYNLSHSKLKLLAPYFIKGEPSNVYFELYNLYNEKLATITAYQQPPKEVDGIIRKANPQMPDLKPNIIDISKEPKVILKVLSKDKISKEVLINFDYSIE